MAHQARSRAQVAELIEILEESDLTGPEGRTDYEPLIRAQIAGTKDKVNRVSAVLAEFDARADACGAEIERLQKRKAQALRNSHRLKDYVLENMHCRWTCFCPHTGFAPGTSGMIARFMLTAKLKGRNEMDQEQRITTLEQARKEIEDNLLVMATLEARQSKLLREQSEYLASHESRLQQQDKRGQATDERIEKLASAIGALIAKMPNTDRPQ